MSIPPLFKHQAETKKKLKKCSRFFDMSEPGTGKTRVECEDVFEARKKNAPPTLVLATRSTLKTAWQDDFAAYTPDLQTVIAYANNREEAFAAPADVYITNHDAVNWLFKQPKKFMKRFEGGRIIIDESTAFKHHTSMRAKNLRKLMPYFETRRMMCGLPDPNGILDLWNQFYLLDDGKRLGNSFFGFRNATCVPITDKGFIKWVERDGIADIVAALVKDISIKHIFEECVDIPKNFSYPRTLALSKSHTKHYKEMEKDMLTVVGNRALTALNKATLRDKLLQIASGAVYNNNEDDYTRFETDRYEFVHDLAQEAAHSVIFFQWKHQRDELIKEANKRGIKYAIFDGATPDNEREEITKAFQAGELDEILAHPKSAAHGLTWTKGTRTIWASPTDNLEWYVQGLKRIYRIGQSEKTETITVIAEGTYDEIAWERLTGKTLRSDEFSTRLRELL